MPPAGTNGIGSAMDDRHRSSMAYPVSATVGWRSEYICDMAVRQMIGLVQQYGDLPAEGKFLCNMIIILAVMEYIVLFFFYDAAVIIIMHFFGVLAFTQQFADLPHRHCLQEEYKQTYIGNKPLHVRKLTIKPSL